MAPYLWQRRPRLRRCWRAVLLPSGSRSRCKMPFASSDWQSANTAPCFFVLRSQGARVLRISEDFVLHEEGKKWTHACNWEFRRQRLLSFCACRCSIHATPCGNSPGTGFRQGSMATRYAKGDRTAAGLASSQGAIVVCIFPLPSQRSPGSGVPHIYSPTPPSVGHMQLLQLWYNMWGLLQIFEL